MRLCHRCGYSREGLPEDRSCPECGEPSPGAALGIEGNRTNRHLLSARLILGLGVAVLIDLLVASYFVPVRGNRADQIGTGDITLTVCIGCSTILPIVFLVGLVTRHGPRERWQVRGDRLRVTSADAPTVLAEWPLSDVAGITGSSTARARPTIELHLKTRAEPVRHMFPLLPIVAALSAARRISEHIQDRHAEARRAAAERSMPIESERDAEGVGLSLPSIDFPRELRIHCPTCGRARLARLAHDDCACGQAGLPATWTAIPLHSAAIVDYPNIRSEGWVLQLQTPGLVRAFLIRLRLLSISRWQAVLLFQLTSLPTAIATAQSWGAEALSRGGWIFLAFIATAVLSIVHHLILTRSSALLLMRPDAALVAWPHGFVRVPIALLNRAPERALSLELPEGFLFAWMSAESRKRLDESLRAKETS